MNGNLHRIPDACRTGHCRGSGFTLERFERYRSDATSEPIRRCAGCGRTGYRETFDPLAAALDARLGLPRRHTEGASLQAARRVRRMVLAA